MKTLLTLFAKERDGLETQIKQTNSSNQIVRLVQNQIDTLERNHTGELNVRQVRLVKFFLDTLRQSISTFASNKPGSNLDRSNQNGGATSSRLLKLLQILTTVGVFISLFSVTQDTPAGWMTFLLMSLLVGLEVALQSDKANRDNIKPIEIQPVTQIDSKLLLDNLAEALNNIDGVVAQAETVPKLSNGIEDTSEIIDFLQKLWGASLLGHPQMTLELTKLVPQLLQQQGIKVQNYQLSDEQSRNYFDFEPSIDPASREYITITPALLKGDRLVRRGRVIEPADTRN